MSTVIGTDVTSATLKSKETTTQKTSTSGELGKDDFLKLLVTQLQNQDPMKPMEDKEFISQMAQFSSLEQMKNMNTSMLTVQASNMIGSNVKWNGTSNEALSGDVKGVKIVSGQPSLTVEIDACVYNDYMPAKIEDLVGKKIMWVDSEKVSHVGVIESTSVVDGDVKIVAVTADSANKLVKSTIGPKQIASLLVETTVDIGKVTNVER